MANKKTTKTTSKKKAPDKAKKEVKEVENELATDFIEEKKKKTKEEQLTKTKKIEIEDSIEKEIKPKTKKHFLVHLFLIILLIVALGSFIFNILDKTSSVYDLISGLLLTIFTIFYVTISISYHRKSKILILISALLLLAYFGLNLCVHSTVVDTKTLTVPNFQNKSLTEVMKWANKNEIKVNQEYEYSDMIPEYEVISQEIEKKENKITAITVSISEGPNPYKEVIVPSMITWDAERVINFVKENYLSNVLVEFVSSDKDVDTVIEQSASGNLKRNDELKLTFSFGEELGYDSVKLIDFTKKSKFEVEFFMKQHQLNYEIAYDFSSSINRGYAMSQSIEAGTMVPINADSVVVTISKGPKIKIPDLKEMNLEELTEWAIKNKVKLVFTDQYDEAVKENEVIGFNYEKGDVVEQGTVIKVILSRGALKMPKFNNINDFYIWADKYGIKYEEKHEFSDTIKAGEIISFSYKTGAAIKNNDTVIVTISDGEKQTVPSVVGLTKSEAIAKLEKAGLNYSFVYQNSSRTKNKVLDQSISAGSEVSSGTTITITLSTGQEDTYVEERKENNNPNNKPSQNTTPSCTNVTVYIYDELIALGKPSTTCSNIKGAYSNLKFSCSYVKDSGYSNGMLKNATSIDGVTKSTCETINLVIVNNT